MSFPEYAREGSIYKTNAGRVGVQTVTWTENASGDEVMREAGEEDVGVMCAEHLVVLMTAFDDDDLAWYMLERDPAFLDSIAKARRQVELGKTISHDDLKRDLGLN